MSTRAKILIVEDESIVALDLEQQLLDLGYDVPAIEASGEKAVRTADKVIPDLILMDIQLQDEMDGITAALAIKSKFRVPVVYLTAYADETVLNRARQTEPHGYLVKPFNEETLRTTVEMALHKFQSERDFHQYAIELEQKNLRLELLNRLVKTALQVSGLKELMRTACAGLVELLKLPYTFTVALDQSATAENTLFECVGDNPNVVATQLTPEVYRKCQKYFIRDKPWIIQNVYQEPCLALLKLFPKSPTDYQLFVLPLVVNDTIVGVLGLGAHHINDISVNDIRTAWNIVTEIANTLENINASEIQQKVTEVLSHSNISIIMTNRSGAVRYANPAFEKNTGYLLQECIGYPLLTIQPLAGNTDPDTGLEITQAISDGKSWYGILKIQPRKGAAFDVQSLLWPVIESTFAIKGSIIDATEENDTPTVTNFLCFLLTHNVSSNNR